MNRFDFKEDISGQTQVKSSAQRAIRTKLQQQFPALDAEEMDEILPKKSPIVQLKGYQKYLNNY